MQRRVVDDRGDRLAEFATLPTDDQRRLLGLFGTLHGLVSLEINSHLAPPEAAYIVQDCDAQAAFALFHLRFQQVDRLAVLLVPLAAASKRWRGPGGVRKPVCQ